ncbi:hypothetical protein, partial [Methylomonas sp. Kb3]|uniref:hypothetical protein n=1 Tax=Methylomonas sp. Kb3 TaxID=1611544 RepID=UPI00197C2B89
YRLIENSINMARQSIFKGIMTKWQQPLSFNPLYSCKPNTGILSIFLAPKLKLGSQNHLQSNPSS